MKGSVFSFHRPVGRAKWIVFAVWSGGLRRRRRGKLPEKFEDAESNEATSYLPGEAESTAALKATESLQ